MLKKVRPMWDKQVFVIYANDFNLTKTTCITLNTEHFFFFYKKTVANQCITMVFVLKTFKKKIYTLKLVYPFLLILAIGHRKRHVIFFKQNNM